MIEGLLQRASQAKNGKELALLVVNEARSLLSCEHCSLIDVSDRRSKVFAISHVPIVDRTVPFVQWIETVARESVSRLDKDPWIVNVANLSEETASDWSDLCPPELLFIPIHNTQKALRNILVFARHDPFSQGEKDLAQSIGAVWALANRDRRRRLIQGRGLLSSIVVAFSVALSLFIQVPLTVLGEAQIEPEQSHIVTIPFDGIVGDLLIKDGDSVDPGDPLFSLEKSQLDADLEIALQATEVAKADVTRAQKQGFRDSDARRSVASKEAEYQLRLLEARIAEDRLSRAEVFAEHQGIVRLDETEGWVGRPVRAGQRVLEISDPSSVEASIFVPVKDAVALSVGNSVRVFLDDRPDKPIEGVVESFSYAPRPSPLNVMSYAVTVKFDEQPSNVSLGIGGSARIYSDQVSLFYYLFRRPILFVLQHLSM